MLRKVDRIEGILVRRVTQHEDDVVLDGRWIRQISWDEDVRDFRNGEIRIAKTETDTVDIGRAAGDRPAPFRVQETLVEAVDEEGIVTPQQISRKCKQHIVNDVKTRTPEHHSKEEPQQ